MQDEALDQTAGLEAEESYVKIFAARDGHGLKDSQREALGKVFASIQALQVTTHIRTLTPFLMLKAQCHSLT